MNFRLRLIISFTLLIALALGIGGTLLISSSFYSILSEEQSAILREYETVQNNLIMVSYFSGKDSEKNMGELIRQMSERGMAHWEAFSLKTADHAILETGNQSLLLYPMDKPASGTYSYARISDGTGRRLLLYSELPADDETLYLTASFDLSNAYAHRTDQLKVFFVIFWVVILLCIGVAAIFANILMRRLRRLTQATREIADGNLSIRTGLHTGDEFEQLSGDFDRMADLMQEYISQLEEDVQRKENFMGAVAHELKTPLTSIIGYADLIRQGGLEEEERMTAANYIYSEGQRLEKLSHKILDLLLMEKDTFPMKRVSMRSFMEQVLATAYPLAKTKDVNLTVLSDDAPIIVEPDLAKSLLYNLIDNAIKATPAKGSVKVTAKGIKGGCEFEITDTGCGMEEKELSRITEAFYRVDKSRSRSQGGAGLGLSLCKKIVDLHYGNMVFTSKPGKGSRVVVQLFGKLGKEEPDEE